MRFQRSPHQMVSRDGVNSLGFRKEAQMGYLSLAPWREEEGDAGRPFYLAADGPRRFSAAAGWLVGAGASLALIGWILNGNSPSVAVARLPRLVPLTAAAFLGLSLALLAGAHLARPGISGSGAGRAKKWIALGAAWTLAIGGLRTASDLFGWSVALDAFRSSTSSRRASSKACGWRRPPPATWCCWAARCCWPAAGAGGRWSTRLTRWPLCWSAAWRWAPALRRRAAGAARPDVRADHPALRSRRRRHPFPAARPRTGAPLAVAHRRRPPDALPAAAGPGRCRLSSAGCVCKASWPASTAWAPAFRFSRCRTLPFSALWRGWPRIGSTSPTSERRQARGRPSSRSNGCTCCTTSPAPPPSGRIPPAFSRWRPATSKTRLPADFAAIFLHDRVTNHLQLVSLGIGSLALARQLELPERSTFAVDAHGLAERALAGLLVYEAEPRPGRHAASLGGSPPGAWARWC